MPHFGCQLPLESEKKREKKVLRSFLSCFPHTDKTSKTKEAVRFSHKQHDKNEKISNRAVRPSPRAQSEVFTGPSKTAPEIKQD